MKKIILLLITIFSLYATQAQIAVTVNNPTNTTPNLNATYTTLAGAVTALSGITAISGPVTLTCTTGTETAPAGGYVINFIAVTTAINNVVIDGQASTVTASPSLSSGSLTDAIFKIFGSDFVTLQGFTMLENGSNTTTTAATNNMTEFGVALFYASATNGAQNNTIQNNTITLSRLYQNSFGIYSNTNHTATSVTVSAFITNPSGSNSGNKVYGNIINNVNFGTVFVGSSALTAVGAQDNGNDIGGSSAATGNTYTNWGGLGVAPSGYVGLTGSNYCIFLNNNYNDNISFNNITSFSGGSTTTIALGGILKNYFYN